MLQQITSQTYYIEYFMRKNNATVYILLNDLFVTRGLKRGWAVVCNRGPLKVHYTPSLPVSLYIDVARHVPIGVSFTCYRDECVIQITITIIHKAMKEAWEVVELTFVYAQWTAE